MASESDARKSIGAGSVGANRVALYIEGFDQRAALIRCASMARSSGERVVTIASERVVQAAPPCRPALSRLVRRMQAGEFDAILAGPYGERMVPSRAALGHG